MAGNRIPVPLKAQEKGPASNELEVKPPVAAESEEAQPIEVVALRKAFYGGVRIKENDKLTIESFDKVGSWMKIVDPKVRKEYEAFLKAKKLEEKKAAGK